MNKFTERQQKAWSEEVFPVLQRHGVSSADSHPYGYSWTVEWHPESRPGRGHFVNAQYCDGEVYAQVTMDVYGQPRVSVAALDWIHADGFDGSDIDCETCNEGAA